MAHGPKPSYAWQHQEISVGFYEGVGEESLAASLGGYPHRRLRPGGGSVSITRLSHVTTGETLHIGVIKAHWDTASCILEMDQKASAYVPVDIISVGTTTILRSIQRGRLLVNLEGN